MQHEKVRKVGRGIALPIKNEGDTKEEYARYFAEANAAVAQTDSKLRQEETTLTARFFDISFRSENEEIQPASHVQVTISY